LIQRVTAALPGPVPSVPRSFHGRIGSASGRRVLLWPDSSAIPARAQLGLCSACRAPSRRRCRAHPRGKGRFHV
jgi:hypothetical protein